VKDQNGLYYYPFPGNKQIRMYVRSGKGDVEFRLWNQKDPMLWSEHGWVPWGAIQKATSMYQGGNFDPKRTYDLNVAKALLKENKIS
jgi:hypothetical protein